MIKFQIGKILLKKYYLNGLVGKDMCQLKIIILLK